MNSHAQGSDILLITIPMGAHINMSNAKRKRARLLTHRKVEISLIRQLAVTFFVHCRENTQKCNILWQWYSLIVPVFLRFKIVPRQKDKQGSLPSVKLRKSLKCRKRTNTSYWGRSRRAISCLTRVAAEPTPSTRLLWPISTLSSVPPPPQLQWDYRARALTLRADNRWRKSVGMRHKSPFLEAYSLAPWPLMQYI